MIQFHQAQNPTSVQLGTPLDREAPQLRPKGVRDRPDDVIRHQRALAQLQ